MRRYLKNLPLFLAEFGKLAREIWKRLLRKLWSQCLYCIEGWTDACV